MRRICGRSTTQSTAQVPMRVQKRGFPPESRARAIVVRNVAVISANMASARKERAEAARRLEDNRRERDRYRVIRNVAHTLPDEAKKVLTLVVDEYQAGGREPVTFFVDDLADKLEITRGAARAAVDMLLYRSLILQRRGRIAGTGYAPNLTALGLS